MKRLCEVRAAGCTASIRRAEQQQALIMSPADHALTLVTLCYPLGAGENHHVSIGQYTNLQDGVSVGSLSPSSSETTVGSFVSIGHGAVLQGCTVADKVLIGMNAVLQDGVKVSSRRVEDMPHWCHLQKTTVIQ